LATHQKSQSKLLKPIDWVLGKFQTAPSPGFIITEYLCRKPETAGLVYPRLSKEIHWKSAAEMAELATADKYPSDFGKAALIALLKSKGAKFVTGMDFGYSHNFSTVTFAILGMYVFILDCYSQAGLQLDEQTTNCEYLKTVYDNPSIYADPAYPASIKTFRTRGYRAYEWDKLAFSVKAGIEIVRSLLWSGNGTVRLFFLKADSGVELLIDRAVKYKFKVDAVGKPTEEPLKKDDDELDAMRYGIMNALGSDGALKEKTSALVEQARAKAATPSPLPVHAPRPGEQTTWMTKEIQDLTGSQVRVVDGKIVSGPQRKGRFIWSL
jgi:hypothetical protein